MIEVSGKSAVEGGGAVAPPQSAEIWLPVVGWEGYYEVSNQGRVRNLAREGLRGRAAIHHRILKNTIQTPQAGGYAVVDLKAGKRRRNAKVHILVLEAFIGPRPKGMKGCHRNNDRTDARLSNLRWGTNSSNQLDRREHGTSNQGSRSASARLTEKDVRNIRQECLVRTQASVAEQYDVSPGTVSDIVRRKTWAHLS
jgi:hypothetical protein